MLPATGGTLSFFPGSNHFFFGRECFDFFFIFPTQFHQGKTRNFSIQRVTTNYETIFFCDIDDDFRSFAAIILFPEVDNWIREHFECF